MGILISKKSKEKKISTVKEAAQQRVIAVHICKDESNQGEEQTIQGAARHKQKNLSNHANGSSRTTEDKSPAVDENVLSVLRGDLSNYSPYKAKVVRIFISSTFTDTSVERNVLMKDVYPRLKKFCHEHGYEFQVVDMRWGIRDQSMDDHETMELCIREIKNCQNVSTGPSFVSLLSEKYGFRPIPAKISKDEFDMLSTAMPSGADVELIPSWYHLDENHCPPVYVLQPISSHIPDFVNCADEAARQTAVQEWIQTMSKISKILRTAAAQVLFGDEKRKYFASISEIELDKGMMETNDSVYGCWWFKRTIKGLKESDENEAEKYYDSRDDENDEMELYLANLQNRILNTINKDNVRQYCINWNSKGVTLEDEEHAAYISKFCQDVYELISGAVEQKIRERSKNEVSLAVYEEVSQHVTFAKARCETFHGRKDELEKIRSYLEGAQTNPLVVYGESGSGKTSVLAMVSICCREWFCNESAVIIRHLGITPDSSLLRRLLLSLCQQISFLIGQHYDAKQRKLLKVLADDFWHLLQSCNSHFTAEDPLVIILDSLDQLSPEDGAFQLTWLPMRLPPWVKIIISTISNDKYNCLELVKGLIPGQFFVEIPRLPLDDAVRIVNSWLSSNKRNLTTEQRTVLLSVFQKCSLPIFLKVSFEEALRWKSYTPTDEIRLESTVRGAIDGLFERIERRHGKIFVCRSLAYITAAKGGLTESELEDLLSCDDDVLDDVFQYWVPPVRRIPPLLWLRVKHDLSSYLVDRGADESMVVTWYHRQFREAAIERYLSDPREKHYIHAAISEFFLGRWANGSQKPFKDKNGNTRHEDRLVSSQELIFHPEDHCHQGPASYNLRKLNELPFQLVMCGDLDVLKTECLCNYEFLLTQLRARGLGEVLDNFELALSVWPNDKDVMTVHETMKLSTNALMLWPGQLASQLLSRIPVDSIKSSAFLKQLAHQARHPSLMALVPTRACLTSPGGPLLQSLSGSTESHVSLRLCRNGETLVSIGERNEMLVWDVRAGRVVRNIECPGGGTTYSCLTANGDVVIASRLDVIKAWQVSNGKPLFEISGHAEVAPVSICLLKEKEALVTYRSDSLEVIDLDNGEILKQYSTRIDQYSKGTSKVFLNAFQSVCLVVHKDAETDNSLLVELFYLSLDNTNKMFRVVTENDIMALDIVVSDQILVTYVGLGEDLNKNRKPTARPSVASSWQKMALELWDMGTMKPKSTLTAADDSVRCTCITPKKDEIIMLCNTLFVETATEYVCFVKIYSVTDGTSLKLPLTFPSGIVSMCGLGFTCIVTASADKIIRVWDLERSLNIGSKSRKKSIYVNVNNKAFSAQKEAKRQTNGVAAEKTDSCISAPDQKGQDTSMSTATLGESNADEETGHGFKEESSEDVAKHRGKDKKASATSPPVDALMISNGNARWNKVANVPVGHKFLKLRYSTLSTAMQKFDIDSGDILEDLQVICCHDDLIVYLARRMVDSVYAVVAWQLSTDVKMRISELQNPDACVVRANDLDHLVIVSSNVMSLYRINSGEFVRCQSVSDDSQCSEKLTSLRNRGVVLIEAGRRSLKVFSVPELSVQQTVLYEENVTVVRTIGSKDRSHFAICLRTFLPDATRSKFSIEVWSADTLQRISLFEYESFESEFNDAEISNDGSLLADIVFDQNDLRYCLVVWRKNSSVHEIVPCDSSLNVFTMKENSKELLIGTWTGDLLVFDTDNSILKHLTKAHACPLHFLLASESCNTALTIAGVFDSRDRSIRLWDTKNGRMLTEYTPDVKILPIKIANDSRYIIVEVRGKLVKLELLSVEDDLTFPP